MKHTMTVKGIGRLSLEADRIEVRFHLRSKEKEYAACMEKAGTQLAALTEALMAAGFPKDALKTSDFRVNAEYEGRQDENGIYRNFFVGYVCGQEMHLDFDLDMGRLNEALSAIAGSVAEPELDIRFTVKDQDAAKDALLEAAARNAAKEAKVLAKAAGVKLGDILSVRYSREDVNLYSPTYYSREAKCMNACGDMAMEMTPDEIKVEDFVTFVWEIE